MPPKRKGIATMTARKALPVKKIKQEETSESSESESAPEKQCIDSDSCSENNDYDSDDRPSDDDLYINRGFDKDGYLRPAMPKEDKKAKEGRRNWNQKIRSRKHRWCVTKSKYGYLFKEKERLRVKKSKCKLMTADEKKRYDYLTYISWRMLNNEIEMVWKATLTKVPEIPKKCLDADGHRHTTDIPSQIRDSTPIEYCTHTRYADDDKPIKKSHKPMGVPKKEEEAEMEKKLRAEWSCVVKENQKLLELFDKLHGKDYDEVIKNKEELLDQVSDFVLLLLQYAKSLTRRKETN